MEIRAINRSMVRATRLLERESAKSDSEEIKYMREIKKLYSQGQFEACVEVAKNVRRQIAWNKTLQKEVLELKAIGFEDSHVGGYSSNHESACMKSMVTQTKQLDQVVLAKKKDIKKILNMLAKIRA